MNDLFSIIGVFGAGDWYPPCPARTNDSLDDLLGHYQGSKKFRMGTDCKGKGKRNRWMKRIVRKKIAATSKKRNRA